MKIKLSLNRLSFLLFFLLPSAVQASLLPKLVFLTSMFLANPAASNTCPEGSERCPAASKICFQNKPQLQAAVYDYIANGETSDAAEKYGDISTWCFGEDITDMSYLFYGTEFNGDIGPWNLSNIKDTSYMFLDNPVFNQDISSWDLSNLKNMSGMFEGTVAFDQDISRWNTSNVSNMFRVFCNTGNFNQDISSWDFSNVNNTSMMFYNAKAFDQNLCALICKIQPNTNVKYMFEDRGPFYKKNPDLSSTPPRLFCEKCTLTELFNKKMKTAGYRYMDEFAIENFYLSSYYFNIENGDDMLYVGRPNGPSVAFDLSERKHIATYEDSNLTGNNSYISTTKHIGVSEDKLITVDIDGTIRVFDKETSQPLCKAKSADSNNPIWDGVSISKDLSMTAVFILRSGEIAIFNAECEEIRKLKIDDIDAYSMLAFSPDNNFLGATTSDSAYVIDLRQNTTFKTPFPEYIIRYHRQDLLLWVDNTTFAVAGSRTNILVCKYPFTSNEVTILTHNWGPINQLALHPNGKLLASAGECGIDLFNLEDNSRQVFEARPKRQLSCNTVVTVAFSNNGTLLAAGLLPKNDIQIWDVATGSLLHYLHTEPISEDLNELFFGDNDKRIYAIHATGGIIRTFGVDQTLLKEEDYEIIT